MALWEAKKSGTGSGFRVCSFVDHEAETWVRHTVESGLIQYIGKQRREDEKMHNWAEQMY